ncbi:MAG: hypothetical protein JO142_01045 [Burkholderiales bacterium]|nr:hypothetical protein [Burkholderiales bacterium]
MQTVSLILREVTDLAHRRTRNGARYTAFRFSADGIASQAVRVDGHVIVAPGASLTMVLTRDRDWQSLAGWYDRSTGQCVTPNDGYGSLAIALLIGLLALVCVLGYFVVPPDMPLHASSSAALFGAGLAGTSVWLVWRAMQSIRARGAIHALRDAG